MEYNSFVEIDNNGVHENYYYNTETKRIGRKLNANEDDFLRLVYQNKFYSFSFVNRIFNLMKDADENRWLTVLSGATMFINEKDNQAKL